MTDSSESRAKGPYGCTLALAIGFLTVAHVAGSRLLLIGVPLNLADEWGPYLFNMLLVAAPFALLEMAGVRGPYSWGTALAVTVLIWSLVLAAGLIGAAEGTGVNFGVVFLLLASPVIVAGAGLAAGRLAREM